MSLMLNGRLYADQEAVISVYDHGFLYGMGLFETFRTYGGVPFLPEAHLRRLREGCRTLGIPFAMSKGELQTQIGRLLAAMELCDAYFRLTVSAGEGILGLPSGDYAKPNVLLYAKPLPPRDENVYRSGKSGQKLKLPRNTPEGEGRLKSFHYMNNLLAKRELAEYAWASGAEGLFLNGEGFLAEGIVSNLFWVTRSGLLRTPSLDTGILPGITRAHVLRLAEKRGLICEEGRWPWPELVEAAEAFVTNSIQELVPLTRLFEETGVCRELGDGLPGPVTRQLMRDYERSIEEAETDDAANQ